MSKIAIFLFCVALLNGCATADQISARNNREAALTGEVYTAKKQARIECGSKTECDKAFSLAKIFVHENADMRVQSSDDTVISTYGATQYGYCGMSVARIPGPGDTATIAPTITCLAKIEDSAPKEIALYHQFAAEMNKLGTLK